MRFQYANAVLEVRTVVLQSLDRLSDTIDHLARTVEAMRVFTETGDKMTDAVAAKTAAKLEHSAKRLVRIHRRLHEVIDGLEARYGL